MAEMNELNNTMEEIVDVVNDAKLSENMDGKSLKTIVITAGITALTIVTGVVIAKVVGNKDDGDDKPKKRFWHRKNKKKDEKEVVDSTAKEVEETEKE